MARKKKINLGGTMVEGTEIGFRPSGEHWNEYLLDDGTVIRIKLVLTSVIRADDVFDNEGQPVYYASSQNVMGVSAPDDLRRDSDADDQ